MKESFLWLILGALNILYVIEDITKNDYGFSFYLSALAVMLAVYLYFEARIREAREAEAKKAVYTFIINHSGPTDEQLVKKIAHTLEKDMGR